MTISPTIFMQGVSKRYGDSYVVRDVDLSVAPGECEPDQDHSQQGSAASEGARHGASEEMGAVPPSRMRDTASTRLPLPGPPSRMK